MWCASRRSSPGERFTPREGPPADWRWWKLKMSGDLLMRWQLEGYQRWWMLWVVLEAGWGDYLNRFGTLERSISVTWICSNCYGKILFQSGSQGLLELNQLFVWLKLDTFNQPTQHICKQTSHAVCCFFPEVPCTSLPFALCSGTKSKQSNINNFSYTAPTAFAFNFANDFFFLFVYPGSGDQDASAQSKIWKANIRSANSLLALT